MSEDPIWVKRILAVLVTLAVTWYVVLQVEFAFRAFTQPSVKPTFQHRLADPEERFSGSEARNAGWNALGLAVLVGIAGGYLVRFLWEDE